MFCFREQKERERLQKLEQERERKQKEEEERKKKEEMKRKKAEQDRIEKDKAEKAAKIKVIKRQIFSMSRIFDKKRSKPKIVSAYHSNPLCFSFIL